MFLKRRGEEERRKGGEGDIENKDLKRVLDDKLLLCVVMQAVV